MQHLALLEKYKTYARRNNIRCKENPMEKIETQSGIRKLKVKSV
jgi:hypothetical protein